MMHFKLNASTATVCRLMDKDIKPNINWDKVTCRECLMLREFAKKKRWGR